MEKMEENPLSEEDRQRIIDGLMNRKIWRYYKMLSKWAPMLMMLGHWYGVWDYGRYPRAMVIGHGGERQLHYLDIRVGICVYTFGYDTRELLFPLLLDIQNTVLLLFRHQCDTALLPTLADNS